MINIEYAIRQVFTLVIPVVVAASLQPAMAAQTGNPAGEQSSQDSAQRSTRQFGGPDGVTPQLQRAYADKESTLQADALQRAFKPWFDWKKRIEDKHGFSIGASAYWLYQKSSESQDEDDALGQIYRLQGSWNLFGKDTGHPGRIEWRIEHRSAVGSNLAPSQLSSQIGVAALNTGFGYNPAFDTDLAVFNWTQLFNHHNAGLAIGRLAFDVYLDAFPFQTFSRGFLNRSFILNPTVGTTGVGGLGAVAKGFITDRVWLGGQIHDGNAVSGKFDMDTFDEGEWLKALEIGWAPSVDRYKTDRVQLTWWEKDERKQAGIGEGSGWAVSTSWKVSDKLFPFLRFGHSDGGAGVAASDSLSAGFEYSRRPDQVWSVGLGWADPVSKTADVEVKNEYVIETSYKFQLLKNFSLLPDVQLVLNPANNPTEDHIWIIGLRGILTL